MLQTSGFFLINQLILVILEITQSDLYVLQIFSVTFKLKKLEELHKSRETFALSTFL